MEETQERTEEATERRLKETKKKGQVPRSRELVTAAMTITSAFVLLLMCKKLFNDFSVIFKEGLSLQRTLLFSDHAMINSLKTLAFSSLKSVFPFFVIIFITGFVSSFGLGGFIFNSDVALPKMERVNVFKGIKKMFSKNALMELIKAILKFTLVGTIGFFILSLEFEKIIYSKNFSVSFELLSVGFLFISLSLLFIVALDIPFQIFSYISNLKMTKQELKDEMKETEGRPEVKSHIRRMQRELGKQRMMNAVPKADVVVVNPTHYAVALQYTQNSQFAPKVIAKGKDLVAAQIRTIAEENKVTIVSAPPLARALYFSTKLDQEIPSGLYVAVAQIIAYVYQIKKQIIKSYKLKNFEDLPIPDELRR